MNPLHDNAKLRDLWEQLQKVPNSEREALISAACEGDPGVAAKVRRLFEEEIFLRWRDASALRPGQIVNARFSIIRLLGSGVFEAQDLALDQTVALKTLRPALSSESLAQATFLRGIASRLAHPGICRVYDVFTISDPHLPDNLWPRFVTMELLHGENLESHIHSPGPLPPGIALEISNQLAEALAYAHSCGVIHGDLKPSNIILTREPFQSIRAVITDFGIASSVHELAEQQNEIAGTRAYMAPERFHGEVSPASDVFALGMIMYEMVTGERPSPDDLQQRTGPPRPISRSHAARYFKRAILRCLNTDPELRFSDGQEVLDALTRASRIKQLLAMPSELYRRISAKNKNLSARFATRTRCEWAVVLDGALELFDTVRRSQLELELRRLSGDQTLRVREVRRGSIILVLDGSEEGYRVISELFKSGQLRQILGLTVQDVSLQNTLGAGTLSAREATPVSDMNTGCRVFISYSHKDARFVNKLVSHLSVMRNQGLIYAWYDRKIDAGREWKHLIDENLDSAQVVLLLVSPDFLASEYCYGIELNQALERHNKGQARVVPVILRPSDWKSTVLADLQALPTDGKPISQWSDRDAAFDSVTQELRRIFEAMTRAGTRL